MSEQTAQLLLREVLSMKAKVILVESKTRDTHTRLFGNGQPGELANLKNTLEEHDEWITRADEREKNNRKWTALIAAAFGTAASYLMKVLFKGHA